MRPALLALALCVAHSCVSDAEPGAAAPPLVLAGNGAARALILAPASPAIVEKYAAEQMATGLGKMSGGAFRIVNEAASPPQSYGQPVISIGRTALSKDLPMQGPDWKRANPEAFRIVRRGDALIICGNPAGATPDYGAPWGVYAFLEMQGVGSYMGDEPLGEVFPSKPDIAVDEMDVTDAPWFEMRGGDDKPAPEAPAPGPPLCLTGDADVPPAERIDSGVAVAFDQPATGGPDNRKLFDGQTDGSEHSLSHGGAFPVWTIGLDLQKAYQIDRVEICTGMTSGRWDVVPIYIEVQVSADGKDFTPVERILPRTLKGFAQSGDLFVTARHVRFRLASPNLWHAVSEVRVWGRPAPAVTADAPPRG